MYKKSLLTILLVCVMVLVMLGACVDRGDYIIQITPIEERQITLEYGAEFQDPGADGVLINTSTQEETPIEVTILGEVDTNTVGSYMLCYRAEYNGYVGTAYRRVTVVDTQAPVITLTADPEYYTLPNEAYVEEGYTASDGYDGDLTQQVKRVETKETVTYTVMDSSGNITSVVRQIVYNDPIPPEITLSGNDYMVISVGDDYIEPGYAATDNCDGDITGQVSCSGSVNTFRSGTYKLTYTVSDAYQNTAQVTRTVFVKEREVDKVNDLTKTDKVIYLTFDDGPGAYTERLLDILAKYNAKATFFVVDTRYISTIKRAAEEEHAIGIHTATHDYHKIYASEEAYFSDLEEMGSIIYDHTGIDTKLIRFPGGSSNTVSSFNEGIMTRLTKLVEEKGYTYFDWNVSSGDAGETRSANGVYRNVISGVGTKEKAVVLLHDIKSYTVDAIEKIIVWGLDNGYTFLPLDQNSPTCHHAVNN